MLRIERAMGTVRFLLALCVVVTHSSSQTFLSIPLFSAVTAVQGFYIVSGFLITMVLNERREYQSAFVFYRSRYLRLWPAYICVAAVSLVVLHSRRAMSLPGIADVPAAMFIAVSN